MATQAVCGDERFTRHAIVENQSRKSRGRMSLAVQVSILVDSGPILKYVFECEYLAFRQIAILHLVYELRSSLRKVSGPPCTTVRLGGYTLLEKVRRDRTRGWKGEQINVLIAIDGVFPRFFLVGFNCP